MFSKTKGLISNTHFVLIERLFTTLLSLLSIVAIARIMGAADFGSFSYVSSVAGIFLAAGHLGLDGLLVKKFVEAPQRSSTVMGTTFFLKFTVLFFSGLCLISYGYYNPIHTGAEQLLFLFFGLIFLSNPVTSVLNAWFQANEYFKFASTLRILVVLMATLLKLFLVFKSFSIDAVGLAHSAIFVVEAFLVYLLLRFLKGPNLKAWHFSSSLAKVLIKEGAPLFVGTILAILYFKVDIIMLRYFHDEVMVGNYALVPQVLQLVQIFPIVLAMVAFPKLVRLLNVDEVNFLVNSKKLYSQIYILAFILSITIFFIGGQILILVFGEEYTPTVPALKIACGAIPFLFIRIFSTRVFIAMNMGAHFVFFKTRGHTVNIGINLALIPQYGGEGAAIATVCSLFCSSIISLCLFEESRKVLRIIFGGLIHIFN